ncbi:TetR/AcrR family transcriptional regulator [Streptomyces sp. NPDC048290]|uniref:TetR/AcrR family transcriptional regulator n=1 Tax=Streptomyces sp. NPDC048290 TaxID=3155811 RepID=UPI0034315978
MARAERGVRASVWLVERDTRRGARRPSPLDRERITAATVRLLDAGGLDAFSMRRLAAELKVTAMSVYWYVDTKDDLLELALDAVYGELALPEERDADWRGPLRALATEYRRLLVRHPWLPPLAGRYLNIGPQALVFARHIHTVMRRAGLPDEGVPGAISAVFRFVYGYGTVEGHFLGRVTDSGLTPDAYYRQVMDTVGEHPGTAEAVTGARDILAARGGATVADMLDRDFAFALDLLVAGIEAMAARARQQGSALEP